MDNQVWICIDFQHVKPGKGNTVMRTKLKNVTDGRVLERTFQVGFKLEDVRIEHRPYQYLYEDTTAKKTGLFSQSVMKKFKNSDTSITLDNLNRLCAVLEMQPRDIIKYVETEEDREKYLLKMK